MKKFSETEFYIDGRRYNVVFKHASVNSDSKKSGNAKDPSGFDGLAGVFNYVKRD